MIVTEVRVQIEVQRDPNRSGGLHASQIIRAAGIRGGVIKSWGDEDGSIPDDDGPGLRLFDDDAALRIMMGLAWEAEVFKRNPQMIAHPGEYHLDGISMSPDALVWDTGTVAEPEPEAEIPDGPLPVVTTGWDGRWRVVEIKLTYKSARRAVEEFWAYLTQMKMYCRAVGTTAAELHVCFVCGDYGRPIRPMYKCWRIEFTELEIEECWEQMLAHAKSEGRL